MSAPWSLLEGKQTFPNVDYKRPLHYDPQDTEGRLKAKADKVARSRLNRLALRDTRPKAVISLHIEFRVLGSNVGAEHVSLLAGPGRGEILVPAAALTPGGARPPCGL